MGCFGYICKGCGTPVRGNCFFGGEKCVMMHVRHGQEVGRVEGHYDEYGRVIEQSDLPEEERFRGDNENINSHKEICDSEFNLEDSYEVVVNKRRYVNKMLDGDDKAEALSFSSYVSRRIDEEIREYHMKWHESDLFNLLPDTVRADFERKLAIASTGVEKLIVDLDIRYALIELRHNNNNSLYEDYLTLPKVELEHYSGLAVWHSYCYRKATDEQKADLTPSLQDPNQSWGNVRKKYS